MFRRISAAMLIAVMLAGTPGGTTSAQPSGNVGEVPTSCAVLPVGFLSLLAILNDMEMARYQPPVSTIARDDIVVGTSVSAQDMLAIKDTTAQLVGCVNSGEVLSAVGLLTERFQARLVVEVVEGDGIDALLEQLPVLVSSTTASGGIQAIPIDAAWYADADARSIMAMMEPQVTDSTEQPAFLVTFVFSIDRWLIDDIQMVEMS